MPIDGINNQNKSSGILFLVCILQVLYIPMGYFVKYLDVSGLACQLTKTNKLLSFFQLGFWYKLVFLIVATYAVYKLFKKDVVSLRISSTLWMCNIVVCLLVVLWHFFGVPMELWFPGSYFKFYTTVSVNIFISGLFVFFYRNKLKLYPFIELAKENGVAWKSGQNCSVVLVLVFIIIYPVGYVGGYSALNYNGYCFFNESKILSEEEQIEPVVKKILEDYPNIKFAYDELPNVGNYILKFSGDEFPWSSSVTEKQGAAKINANQLVPYKSMDEFFAINPECCNFTQKGLYGPVWGISFVEKIAGEGAGFVNIKYKVRYFDGLGKIHVKWQAFSAKRTNCGISVCQ